MKKIKNMLLIVVLLTVSATATVTAQVTIGANTPPQSFSALELISGGNKGMRLPQMSDTDKTTAFGADNAVLTAAGTAAQGLQIFNTDIRCIETWNGVAWIQTCPPGGPYIPLPPTKGGDTWGGTPWVGAFWKDNQTGERVIASPNTAGVVWTAVVDDPSGAGSWLVLEANGGTNPDPNLWTDAPGDAESYQVSGTATSVSSIGDILFRIGAKTVNPQTDISYDTGKKPRYATITLTVGTNPPVTLYCRQGESADYVFTSEAIDNYDDPDVPGVQSIPRSLAKKFSPYNLTDAALTESVTAHQAGYRGGSFVDFPTKGGALFQWGMNANITYAYHPTQPVSGWSASQNTTSYWDVLKAAQETCPNGWRRPNDGVIDAAQVPANGTADYTANNIYNSEMRQSLYAVPKNDRTQMTETTGRAWGYYADGYFDRRPIVTSITNQTNSVVSRDTKDLACIGTLFFNAANGNRSLFAPAAGGRNGVTGVAPNSGDIGFYWSGSSLNLSTSWLLFVTGSYAYEAYTTRNSCFSVRCVKE